MAKLVAFLMRRQHVILASAAGMLFLNSIYRIISILRPNDDYPLEQQCLGEEGQRLVPLLYGGEGCILQNRSVFFLETRPTFRNFIGRRLCSFESTARYNPDKTIIVIISDKFEIPQINLEFLSAIPNLYLMQMNYESMMGPELLSKLEASPDYISQSTDVLRMLLLSKYGGFYLDTDVVSLKPLPDIRNFVVEDIFPTDGEALNGGVAHFDRGNEFLEFVLEQIRDPNLKLSSRQVLGPYLLTEAKEEFCPQPNRTQSDPRIKFSCPGDFKVLDRRQAHAWDNKQYMSPRMNVSQLLAGIEDSFVAHYFGSRVDHRYIREETPLIHVMDRHCPRSVKVVREEIVKIKARLAKEEEEKERAKEQ